MGSSLFSTAHAASIIDSGLYTTLLLVISASMAFTPIVVRLGDRLAARLAAVEPEPTSEEVPPRSEALVVGYGRVGRIVMATLQRAGVVADRGPTSTRTVSRLGRRLGHRVVYGDAADPRLLDRVGSADTRVVVAAVSTGPIEPRPQVSAARTTYPQALMLARAHDDDRRPKAQATGSEYRLN